MAQEHLWRHRWAFLIHRIGPLKEVERMKSTVAGSFREFIFRVLLLVHYLSGKASLRYEVLQSSVNEKSIPKGVSL